jgi:hypothetical protein
LPLLRQAVGVGCPKKGFVLSVSRVAHPQKAVGVAVNVVDFHSYCMGFHSIYLSLIKFSKDLLPAFSSA